MDTVLNQHTHEHGKHHHEDGHSHNDLIKSIAACAYIIVNLVGKHLKFDLEKNAIGIFKTKETTIEAGIVDFISNEIIK